MTYRRGFWGAVLIAALLLARSPAGAGGAPTEACCLCDCDGPDVCVTSFDCTTTCMNMACTVASNQVCAVGSFAGCDANCGAICNTPTPTSTATVTATIISTPGPAGAPASSPRGLAIGVGMLALIAALALRRRRI